jgi:hypothetical protein
VIELRKNLQVVLRHLPLLRCKTELTVVQELHWRDQNVEIVWPTGHSCAAQT